MILSKKNMSTKDKSRTALEAGTNKNSRYYLRLERKTQRAQRKQICKQITNDIELAEEFLEPKSSESKCFSDNVSFLEKYLQSKVGQVWDDVRSEIAKEFDGRTIAGKHILYDHILRSVVSSGTGYDKDANFYWDESVKVSNRFRTKDFYVDQNGILQEVKPDTKLFKKIKDLLNTTDQELLEVDSWLRGRMIVQENKQLFWKTSSTALWKCKLDRILYRRHELRLTYYIENYYYDVDKKLKSRWEEAIPFDFNQTSQLSNDDIDFFNAQNELIRDAILDFSSRIYNLSTT